MRALPALATVVLTIGLGACTAGVDEEPRERSSAPAARPASAADFVDVGCPEDVAAVVVGEVSCGYLTVPEDRSAPGREVRVFVSRISPAEVLHEDPMLVAGTDLASLPNYGGVAPLAQRVGREVIVMDARGVGHSEPSLACPEVDERQREVLAAATSDEATRTDFLEGVAGCHDRITAGGADPAAYNLEEMAADAEDLRLSLGIDEWNVVSYGTASRIVLEMVRQSPEHLRSVLLDSPEVPGSDPRAVAADVTRAALTRVLGACATSPRCAASYPGTRTLLDRALTRLAVEPVTLRMGTAGQRPQRVRMDDAMLLRLARGMLSDGGSSGSLMTPASVPAVLQGVVDGRIEDMAPLLAPAVAGSPPYCLGYLPKCLPQHRSSAGALYSVLCHDIDPLHDAAAVRDSVPGSSSGYAPAYGDSPYLDVCGAWSVTGDDSSAAGERGDAVASEVPTLVMVGAYSPYSSEAGLRDGLRGMRGATFVVDPAGGHNVMGSDCLVSVRGAWLEDFQLTRRERACLADRSTDWAPGLASLGLPSARGTVAAPPARAGTAGGSLEGTWGASLTRGEIRRALVRGDLGRLTQRFLDSEGIARDGIRVRTTFEDGRFSQAYRGSAGAWQVGWEAAAEIQGSRVMIVDAASGGTDTLRWEVTGDRARLLPTASTSPLYKGMPQVAYLWAYLAADTHRRTD